MRWIMGMIVVAFLLSTFLMYDSGSRRGGERNSSGQMSDYTVAEVNGRHLMRSELDRRVRQYLEEYGNKELSSTDLPLIYQSALNQYAMELQLAKEVKDSGILISEADADQAMKDYADQMFPTREAFYESLERSGVKLADYKKSIAQQMANQQLMQASIGTVAVSEDEAVQFYENTKNLFFKQPAGVKVSMANFSAKEDAEKIRALLAEGQAWEKATSGDVVASMDVIGITAEPMFVPDSTFDDKLASMKDLKIGDVSPVFELASSDFAVGVKNEAIEEKISPYDEVSADIRSLLQQQKEREAMSRFSQNLIDNAKIVIQDASLFPAKTPEILPVTETETTPQSADVLAPVELQVSSDVAVDTAVVSGK